MLYINKITSHTTVDFAAEELKKYLRMMMPEDGDVKITYAPDAECGFRLGVMAEFGLDTSDVRDAELDDIIYIETTAEGGIIAGSNPRSVLIAVYEYLRQNGCRWLFPGVDGEYIPMQSVKPVSYRHAADSRYRGNCIEGAVSQDVLNDYIDFMPKLGLNTFMIQFRVPEVFYDRYFGHSNVSKVRGTENVSRSQILQWTRVTECELAKRGIMLHSYGHGFTIDPFSGGKSFSGWTKYDLSVIPEENHKFIAMINGKRQLRNGVPNNTNFCMSNPEARATVVKYIADYSASHSNTDFLHIWLADGSNGHCECEECAKKRPSDWYVMLMNEVDAELTARGLATRIVFIVYVDTSWAPETEVIKNPDRFTLMLAPITRDYNFTLLGTEERTILPYVRNHLTMPKNLAEYLAYFGEWKKGYPGASVCFEYHFWIPMNYDMSGIRIARVLYDDIKLYRAEGLDGIIQCGSQRTFFPHGFEFYVHARALYDASLSFDDILNDYFYHAYGESWREFYDYLVALEKALPYSYFYRVRNKQRNVYAPELAESIKGVADVCARGAELIKKYYNSEERVRTVSVRMLERYNDYALRVSEIAAAKAVGDNAEAERLYNEFVPAFAVIEDEFKDYVDMHQVVRVVESLYEAKSAPADEGSTGGVTIV